MAAAITDMMGATPCLILQKLGEPADDPKQEQIQLVVLGQ